LCSPCSGDITGFGFAADLSAIDSASSPESRATSVL
jgi:hypothetical protein